jgi:hypothetical protein
MWRLIGRTAKSLKYLGLDRFTAWFITEIGIRNGHSMSLYHNLDTINFENLQMVHKFGRTGLGPR